MSSSENRRSRFHTASVESGQPLKAERTAAFRPRTLQTCHSASGHKRPIASTGQRREITAGPPARFRRKPLPVQRIRNPEIDRNTVPITQMTKRLSPSHAAPLPEILLTSEKRRLRHYLQFLAKCVRDQIRLAIIEHQLARKLNRPWLEGPHSGGERPKPSKARQSGPCPKVLYLDKIRTTERLNEYATHSEGRYLRIWGYPRHCCGVIVGEIFELPHK